MTYVTLPFRIRPSRVRLLAVGGVLAAMAVPIAFAVAEQGPQVAAVLAAPSLTWTFAGAVTVCLFVASYVLFLVGFALVALPGAPLLHVDVDARGVTYRRLWHVTRVSFRNTDGWGYVERGLIPVSANVPASTRLYTVVAGQGGFDGHRVGDDRPYAVHINVLPFTPLLEARESFAQDVAMGLTAAARGARQARRPIVIDVGPALAPLAFGIAPRQTAKAAPAWVPGPWRGQAVQAVRARNGDGGARR